MPEEEKRLKKRLRELEEAKANFDKLRKLDSYTDKEKLAEFDRIFNFAMEIMTGKLKGKEPKDAEQYCFEMVMQLLGKGVWDVYNKL